MRNEIWRLVGGWLLVAFLATHCTYTAKIRDGKTAFDRKQFAIAAPLLQKEFARAKTKAEKGKIALLLGQTFVQLHDENNVAKWYKIAYENAAGTDALREHALSLKRQERYAESIEVFNQLGIEIGSPYEYRKEITACNQAIAWKKDTIYAPFSISNYKHNSSVNDYAPNIWNGKLVFSSERNDDRNTRGKTENYEWTGKNFARIYVSESENRPKLLPFFDDPKARFNEATASFSADGNTAVFTKCGDSENEISYCRLYESSFKNNIWSEPEKLAFQKEKTNYGTPALSADGRTLIFSSNDAEGWGGYDLYTASRTSTGGWTEPRLMGRSVNTTGDELYPTLDRDTLYFSSNYHVGLGGLDIFKTYKIFDQRGNYAWAAPLNLLPPLNSGGDDFQFLPIRTGGGANLGYFSSNRLGGLGGDDIYVVESREPQKRPAPPVVVVPPKVEPTKTEPKPNQNQPITYKILLNLFVVEKIFAQANNPNSAVLGKKPLVNPKIFKLENGKTVEIVQKPSDTGGVVLEALENTDYVFSASQEGYLNASVKFSTKGVARDPKSPTQSFDLELVLDKIFKNQEIVLENIYYDYNKSDIRADAAPTLDKLAETLRQNPTIKIQLGSHTDCRGNDRYNQDLSQRRAEAAVAYLIGAGIAPERLRARGFGESSPAVSCSCAQCSEGDHQVNRRTTFSVVE